MHSGPFGCLTKVGAKRVELVQKFVPRSRVGIFRNERTRSTPLDPKMMFWSVLYHLGAFGAVWLSYETRCKQTEQVQKFVPRSRIGILPNERTLSIPLNPKLTFWCVLYHLGAFATICLLTKLGAKRAKLVQKFVPRSRVGIFRNEHTRSTTFDPKLMYWCVSYYLGAFETIWLS